MTTQTNVKDSIMQCKGCYLILAALIVALAVSLQGCSVNVIVAPGATLAVDSLNERQQSAVQFNGPGECFETEAFLAPCAEVAE